MKRTVILLICMLVVVAVPGLCYGKSKQTKSGVRSKIGTSQKSLFVRGYVKTDGTYVGPRMQTNRGKIIRDYYRSK